VAGFDRQSLRKALEKHQYGWHTCPKVNFLAVARDLDPDLSPRGVLWVIDYTGKGDLIEPFRADIERQLKEYEAFFEPRTPQPASPPCETTSSPQDAAARSLTDEVAVDSVEAEQLEPEVAPAGVNREAVHRSEEEMPLRFSKNDPRVVLKAFYVSRDHFEWLKKTAKDTSVGASELVHRALGEYRARHG